MKRRIIALAVCVVMCLSLFSVSALAARDTSLEESMARDLKTLGLFKGVSDTDFDLNRAPTRIEALVMLIRLLGKEEEALGNEWRHPFTDVPGWADRYVGYAYRMGITNGISETQYGAGNASAAQYLTFVLRALYYSDKDGRDFTWDKPFDLAKKVGILPDMVDTNDFWRADVVTVSYAALSAFIKDSRAVLADVLIDAKVFTADEFLAIYRGVDIFGSETYRDRYEIKTVHYEWEWDGRRWGYDLPIPTFTVEYYKGLERDPSSILTGYSSYVNDTMDDKYLEALAQVFINTVESYGYDSKDEAVYMAICFVQALEYIPDDKTLEYDYPKYPLETLFDEGGDCEDTSILLASLIRTMGYSCCLVTFKNHMGVGVLGSDDFGGSYYEVDGKKYYFVETTGERWEVGQLPEDLKNETAKVWPV